MDRRALAVLVFVHLAPVARAHIEDARALSRLARTVTTSNAAATWIETAQLLARNAKWSAAAGAQSRALEALAPMEQADARRDLATGHLLLARYRLHSGDSRGAEAAIDRAPPAARNSISALLLRLEIAIADGDADAAAVLLESLNDRHSEAIDQVALPQLYCNTVPLQAVTVRALLAAQVELLRGETETAISSLESLVREHSSLADAVVLLANALHESGLSEEALARLHAIDRSAIHAPANCPGILSDRVFFNAGNIARDAGDRNAAAELYRRAISVAEKREQELARLVRDHRLEMPASVRTIVSSAILATGDAAPEARNNLGHLLLESSDPLLLDEARAALRAAAESPAYATPQFAHVGHARAEIRSGNWKEALSAIASALWIDPSYRNALELAASTTNGDAPVDAALAAGTVLISAMREASPQAFASSRQQELAARIAERAEHASSEAAVHYLVSYDLYRGDFESAQRRLDQARTKWSTSIWPFARSGEVFGAIGDDARALEMFRMMEKARTERAELLPLNAIAIRQALGTYMTVAANHGAAAEVQFLAEAFGANGIARAQRIPWGPPVRVELVFTDSLGMPLPGTTITISPAAGPLQQVVTGSDGTYTATLPRGSYTVTAELSGLATHTETYYFSRENTRVETAMQAAIVETITVTSDPSMVLVEPGQSITVTAEQIDLLPVRHLTFRVSDAMMMQTTVNGSASAENVFMMNGLNVTSPIETGSGWLARSTASLAQIEITSVGRTADAPDAIVQTETARGTNDVDVKIELGSHPGVDRAEVAVPFERQRDRREWSAAASIGFPIIKHTFFLFARGERAEATGTGGTESPFESTRRKHEGVANFTVMPTSMLDGRINLGVIDERRSGGLEDIARALFGSESAVNRTATHRSGTAILSALIIHSSHTFTTARISALHDETTFRPRTAAGERAQFRLTGQQLFAMGGVGFINDGRVFDRVGLGASLNRAAVGFRWIHDLKGGFEYDEERDEIHDRLSGGEMLEGNTPLGESFVRFWSVGGARTPEIREAIESSPLALYVQDKISFDRVAVNVGVRWSRQTIDFPGGARLSTAVLQPRLNVDFRRERWNLFATYGRYAEHLGGDERAGAGSLRRFHIASNGDREDPGKAYGGLRRIDPDLRGRYDDEISAGFSRFLGSHGMFRANAVRRRRRSDIQDFFCTDDPDLHRCIGNPGRGIMTWLQTLDGDLADAPRARRELDALDMSLRGTKSMNIGDGTLETEGQLGYVWSRLVGNVHAPDLESTRIRGIDPYSRTAFDFKELVPEVGPLARDRRHTFTATGAATMKGLPAEGALTLSASGFWFSGESRGRFGYSNLYGRHVRYLSDRGDEGHSPSAYDFDARLTYEWTLRRARVQLGATMENALDRQTNIIDDQRWNFREDMLGLNPTFLQPMERLGARTIWFTARVRF